MRLLLSLFTSQLIIVFFVFRGEFDADVALALALPVVVAVGGVALPLRSREGAIAAASKTNGDIAMALICSDLGQKTITYSAIQEAVSGEVAVAGVAAAAAASASDVAVAVASRPERKYQR